MARYSWKGFLRLSLVSVPVQAFNVQESGQAGKISLHQLHDKDHARIRYVKVCPQHGEISTDEIVSGYEVSKDEYVVIEPSELDALRTPAEKAITLDSFVPSDSVDLRYFSGRNYYLMPDGEAGVKPYAVLHRAMAKQNKWGVGQAVMFGREHLVLVRPQDELLSLARHQLCRRDSPDECLFVARGQSLDHRGAARRDADQSLDREKAGPRQVPGRVQSQAADADRRQGRGTRNCHATG